MAFIIVAPLSFLHTLRQGYFWIEILSNFKEYLRVIYLFFFLE